MQKWQQYRQKASHNLTQHIEQMLTSRSGLRSANIPKDKDQELLQLLISCDRSRYSATIDTLTPLQGWPVVVGQPR